MAVTDKRLSHWLLGSSPGSGSSIQTNQFSPWSQSRAARYLFHRSTTRAELLCYLQDLYTAPARRGRGIGRALIEGVSAQARRAGLRRVYWQTQASNAPGRALYDRVARHHGFIVYSRDVCD